MVPASYDSGPKSPATAQAALPSLDWWTKFRSRELTALIEEARANNLDIAAAITRIVQADAQARITGAPLLPLVTANGNANQQATKTSSKAVSQQPGQPCDRTRPIVTNDLQATLDASYEIDFWGKNRAALRNAEGLAVASRFDREVVGLTTMASVANAYFQVLAARTGCASRTKTWRAPSRILNLINQRGRGRHRPRRLKSPSRRSLVNQVKQRRSRRCSRRFNHDSLPVLMGRSPEQVRVRGGTLRAHRHSARDAGTAVGIADAAPRISPRRKPISPPPMPTFTTRAPQFLPSITLTGGRWLLETAALKSPAAAESAIYTPPPA